MAFIYKTLDDINLKNKTVLLRVDLNTEIVNKKVMESPRFREHAKTISELKKKKARVVILAHQGRPGKSDFTSLKKHAQILNKYTRVSFVSDVVGRGAVKRILGLKPGEALMLENIRSIRDEFQPEKKDNSLVRVFSALADVYINDAFSVSHRDESSITAFPRYLKSGIGRVMQSELESLGKIKIKECLFILAGAKVEDNLLLLKNKSILSAGLFGQLCTIAKGYNLGAQNKFLKKELRLIPKIKPYLKKITTPEDFAVNANGKRKELRLEDFPSKYEIFDIGNDTIAKYKEIIKGAKSIYVKGTIGYAQDKRFSKGTKAIYSAIANSKAFSILGGGSSTSALEKLKINKSKIGYISLSGGALVYYLAGKKLPGLEALKRGEK